MSLSLCRLRQPGGGEARKALWELPYFGVPPIRGDVSPAILECCGTGGAPVGPSGCKRGAGGLGNAPVQLGDQHPKFRVTRNLNLG